MYTVYIIFSSILVLSFITGNIIQISERKFKKQEKLAIQNNILYDEEIL